MSYIIDQPNSKYWIAGWRDADGKQKRRSTKLEKTERNRKQALKLADLYEETSRKRKTALQLRRVISDNHKALTRENLLTITVAVHVEQWLKSKETTASRATYDFYKGATSKFLTFLGVRKDAELIDITREDIEGFRDDLAQRLAPSTVNHNLKALRMLIRDARDRALIVDDPAEFVKPVKSKPSVEKKPFTMEQIERILEHCDDEWRSMVLFGLYTGQRLGDIASLKWSSVDLSKGEITLTTGKMGKALRLPLHPCLLNHLKNLPAPIDRDLPIHPVSEAALGPQGRTSTLSNRFGRILAKAGIREKSSHKSKGVGRDGKRSLNQLSFHSLRRTATTLLHEAGVPQSVAMALIGHDSEEIHSIYVSVGEKAMRDASARLPSLSERATSI